MDTASRSTDLLVTGNLKEAFEAEQSHKTSGASGRRPTMDLPRRPDVSLLHEVMGKSAADMAGRPVGMGHRRLHRGSAGVARHRRPGIDSEAIAQTILDALWQGVGVP